MPSMTETNWGMVFVKMTKIKTLNFLIYSDV